MKVPFVDLPRQIAEYEAELRPIFEDVVFNRADFIMRQDLIDFENNFALYVGVKHAVGVANGSDALNLTVKVLGIGPGDEVITVSHTFVATIAAIHHAGAKTVLVDVAADYNMDVTKIEEAVTSRTKAIIPVHLNGRVCDMEAIIDVAARNNLFVIEDSAQAIGALYNGKKAGSFGILSTNSFYPFKIIGCFGDGGMIATNDSGLDYQLRCLRDNGQDRQKGEILYYGWNSRLDNLQAALLDFMLKKIPDFIERRRQVAKLYDDGLSGIKDLALPPGAVAKGKYYDVFQNYVIRTPYRDKLLKTLDNNNIGTLISWPKPTHFHKDLKLDHHRLPNTESISKEVISLPMNTVISDEETYRVIEVIKKFFASK